MFKKILNIGAAESNGEALNRKIRISNLISVLSIVIILGFYPLAFYLNLHLSTLILTFFFIASLSSFFLHRRGLHQAAFYSYIISGFIYFIFATLLFGLVSNLHFFMLVMCMIAVVIFDNKIVVKTFIGAAIVTFFVLRWFMNGKQGYIGLPPELKSVEEIVGTLILFLLFIITSIFFIFFKNQHLAFQKDILLQKEIIEEKNKDITASIVYAKRIQQSLLPTDKYIDKTLKRLKK